MPRDNRSNIIARAAAIVNDDAFKAVVSEMKAEALKHLETNNLKAYGQANLERDRAILEYQVVCGLEKRFLDYARRK